MVVFLRVGRTKLSGKRTMPAMGSYAVAQLHSFIIRNYTVNFGV